MEQRYRIIDWTQEREEFCQRIQAAFEKVNTDLNSFITKINNDNFDALMQGGTLPLALTTTKETV